MTWDTQPKDWQHKEVLTAEKMNTEVRDRFEYFKSGRMRQAPIIELPDPAYYTLPPGSTVPVPVNAENPRWAGSFTARGGDIWFCLHCTVEIPSAGTFGYLDILINDDFYLSTMSSDYPTWDGIWRIQAFGVGWDQMLSSPFVWHSPPPGEYTWKLMARANSASYNVQFLEGVAPSFVSVIEM